MVVRADLNGHLKALKDYFLLAEGDFFKEKYESASCFVVHFYSSTLMGAMTTLNYLFNGNICHANFCTCQFLHIPLRIPIYLSEDTLKLINMKIATNDL